MTVSRVVLKRTVGFNSTFRSVCSDRTVGFNSTFRSVCFDRRSEHTDRNVELKPISMLWSTIRAHWLKRWVETKGSFQNHPNSLEIVITWCYRKPFYICIPCNWWINLTFRMNLFSSHWTLLVTTQNNGCHKNLLGNEQWRAFDSIKHREKRLPLT